MLFFEFYIWFPVEHPYRFFYKCFFRDGQPHVQLKSIVRNLTVYIGNHGKIMNNKTS